MKSASASRYQQTVAGSRLTMAGLNPAQMQAVCTPPNSVLQILAGPGSGKTKVLTHRVCFLLQQGIPPENIILTTFTNVILPKESIDKQKAAKEMKERIGKLMDNGVENQLITGKSAPSQLVKFRNFSFHLPTISGQIWIPYLVAKRLWNRGFRRYVCIWTIHLTIANRYYLRSSKTSEPQSFLPTRKV